MCSPDHFITVEKMYSESTAHVILLLMFSFSHLNDTEALLPSPFHSSSESKGDQQDAHLLAVEDREMALSHRKMEKSFILQMKSSANWLYFVYYN